MYDVLKPDNTGRLRGTLVAERGSGGAVAEFCAGLRRLQQGCGLDRAPLARRVGYSRSQLYAILDGQISRPPEWDRFVEPLVRACTGDDEYAVGVWRRRHEMLIEVYNALRHQDRQDPTPKRVGVVPAQLPADVDVFTGRKQELADLDRLLASTTGPDVWTRFFDLRRCQPGVPGDQAFLLDLAL